MTRYLTVFIALLPLIVSAQTTTSTSARIDISINSGNPVYPFPQFQPYKNQSGILGNVGTNNPCGVTHAEMEKTIRDAYRIQMNRAEYKGGTFGGVRYIHYRSNPDCSEGDGYGILGAAAMADKPTFDGMWMWIHDNAMNKVKRYNDCKESNAGYLYSSHLIGWTNVAGGNSATDGDVDVALAILCAYYQWGEFMGIDDACGNPISYKQAAIDVLKGLSDSLTFQTSGSGLLSGDIGLDGYVKNGDSWAELTDWAASTARTGFTKPAQGVGSPLYFDYIAPAYFHLFADFLAQEDSARYAWNIYQFRRAAASSDWLIGQLLKNPKYIPYVGQVTLSATNELNISNLQASEDGRLGWRTILNYVWSGNPTYSWDPVTHQIQPAVSNTYERDMGQRYAKFIWDNRQAPWGNACVTGANKTFSYWGPLMLWTEWDVDGSDGGFFFLNWIQSWGSPSAVASQDFSLMSTMYRQLEIEWDVEEPGDGYLSSMPFYYHGWFRLLGLLVLSGNYPSPADIKPRANTKVYLDIDKSFAFEKDTVTYTIDYRNYGSVDATGTTIVDTLHQDFKFVSATAGGLYDNTSHTVTWNIGTLPGFKTATGIAPTTGKAQLKVVVANATQKQYRNKVSITCANGSGWTSNDYPNHVTSVMERNHLDIARRALILDYTSSKSLVKPGETVDFSINFKNSSEAGWINGGRPGVNFSFSQSAPGGTSTMNTMRARLFHDADEAYIDFGNYRISYFLYDEKNTCISGSSGCTNGWQFQQTITEGINKANVKLVHEMVVPGQDARGKWNQRLIVQFSDPADPTRVENLTTIDHHLSEYRGMRQRIHRGGTDPLRIVWFFNSSDWQEVNWTNAWSWDANTSQDDGDIYFPVTNDWTDPDKPDVIVNHWNRKACKTATKTIDNILVEEWDGYTWRRVAGNGPMPGREATNVVISDTVPAGFTLVSTPVATFNGTTVLPSQPSVTGNRIISWTIPKMQINESGTITFTAKADGSCPTAPDLLVVNRAWISADKESPFADSSELAVSCDTVIKPPPPDHIDIIIDTLVVDSLKDTDFMRLTLDEGTQAVFAYAVVRDKNGKFIRRVTGAQWTSVTATVANAAAVSTTSWQGLITKIGGGSTIIRVSEPGNPNLKPDSLAVTAIATPPWPAISSAIMYDTDGNIIPDLLTVTLNDTFHVNQRPDSVVVDYRGTSYLFAAAALVQQPYTFSIPFTSLTTVDPQPSGQVTLVLTVDGEKKKVEKGFTDGVGPALTAVSLAQDLTGVNDTLRLTFTEEVSMPTIVGRTLQLIGASTGDTAIFSVLTFKGPDIYRETEVVVTSLSGVRPHEGDLVRLLPGVDGGTLVDRKKNLPHKLNRPVAIPERPARLSGGMYVDENADGIVDAVFLKFEKPVQITDVSVSLFWAGALQQRIDNLTGDRLSYGADQSIVRVALPETYSAANGIKTDGAMGARVQFLSDVSETRSADITDMAAPVLLDAVIKVGAVTPSGTNEDTLIVNFSEPVQLGATPYLAFLQNTTQPYSMSLQLMNINGNTAVFAKTGIDGVAYPQTGDLVYITPVSAVGDSGNNWQNNPENRRVVLSMTQTLNWIVQVVPNPFNPEQPVFDTASVSIRILNAVNTHAPTVINDARISIYDKVGNAVVKSATFNRDQRGMVFYWNGTNRRGRKVGSGTYIGIVTVKDEGSQGEKRVYIGVVRKEGR